MRQQHNRTVSVSPFEGKGGVNGSVLWGVGEAAQKENRAAAPCRDSQDKLRSSRSSYFLGMVFPASQLFFN